MAAVRDNCVIAGENLLIAQHRDTLRCARKHSGTYQPAMVDLEAEQGRAAGRRRRWLLSPCAVATQQVN